MCEWLYRDDYAEIWQCYAHIPARSMTASEVMAMVSPGSGLSWPEELRHLWTEGWHDTSTLLSHVAADGEIAEPIIIGPDGRLWDGHHRLACALALSLDVPARVIPKGSEL
ncbi:hypothetical protein HZU38_05450 [Mycolicibacterium vanbaalenii]|uniref:hypothetical protein n=1 Tax=Mycolicibacterium vanbaalenii TaxID=110539 RepID=UPI001F27942C|nr:hypothetical protein [Mycolicibacterium vanbaalenii]UJL29947.1 hypothetical protein HZU38_05450 [Mycolicibacterium vanbaalenii]WND56992.1 hypothetical protein QQA43_00820 [Mycolicibacterium vanbaalenii]